MCEVGGKVKYNAVNCLDMLDTIYPSNWDIERYQHYNIIVYSIYGCLLIYIILGLNIKIINLDFNYILNGTDQIMINMWNINEYKLINI